MVTPPPLPCHALSMRSSCAERANPGGSTDKLWRKQTWHARLRGGANCIALSDIITGMQCIGRHPLGGNQQANIAATNPRSSKNPHLFERRRDRSEESLDIRVQTLGMDRCDADAGGFSSTEPSQFFAAAWRGVFCRRIGTCRHVERRARCQFGRGGRQAPVGPAPFWSIAPCAVANAVVSPSGVSRDDDPSSQRITHRGGDRKRAGVAHGASSSPVTGDAPLTPSSFWAWRFVFSPEERHADTANSFRQGDRHYIDPAGDAPQLKICS